MHSPTQEHHDKKARCSHGYYRNARELKTPRCPTCDPMSYSLDKDHASYALALIALRHTVARRRTEAGKFEAEATVAPGMYRCWCCGEVKPLDPDHFRRAASKATGFQGRCKSCDNKRKTDKRQGKPRPGIEALLAVGVTL